MFKNYSFKKKIILVLAFVLCAAAIAWAAAELSGQANAAAADAGDQSLEMEEISMDMIVDPKPAKKTPPPCDWQKEKKLRKSIEANNKTYKELVAKAKAEAKANGQVSSSLGSKINDSANEYEKLQLEYAEMWEACKCKSRAKLARELAEARVKNAEVVSNEVDEEKLAELKAQQKKVAKARKAYVKKTQKDDEISADDKKRMKANLQPKTKQLISRATGFVGEVTDLMTQVKSTATEATSGGVFGALSAATSIADGRGLLQSVNALLSLAESMVTGAKELNSDVETISK